MSKSRARFLFPLIASIALFGLYWFLLEERLVVRGIDLSEEIFGNDLRGLLFAAYVPLILLVVRLFDVITFDLAMARRRRRGVVAPRLLRDIIALGLYFILISWAVSAIFKFSLARWLTATTILAAILGLALQDTLGNLFSGISLHAEETIAVGDVIRTGEFLGVVEGVSWRATRLRTFASNSLVVLPNSVLARERLEVFPRNNLNARVIQLQLDYNVPPARAIELLTQAATHVEGVSSEIPCFARIASYGESWIVYDIKYFTRQYHQRDRIDAEIRKAAWYALRRNDIPLPFPVRALRRYEPPSGTEQFISPEQIAGQLRKVDILSPLPEEARQTLAVSARVRLFARGETIIRHDSPDHSMFVISEGNVSVLAIGTGAQRESELAQLGAGAVVGEMALLTGEKRTADVVALTDVSAIEITREAMQPILAQWPGLAEAISRRVAERRARLNEIQAASMEEEELTIRSRILSYFGMR